MDAMAYGDAAADLYDEEFSPPVDPGVVEFLVGLAGGGSVLDVGAGTGRVALPLAQAGCPVTAVDISEHMCAAVRAKSAGLAIECLQQDVTVIRPPGSHQVAICLFNTLYMLGDPAAQSRALANIADCLLPGGRLLIEAFLPDSGRFSPRGDLSRVRSISADRVVLQFSLHHAEVQRIDGSDVVLRNGSVRLVPFTMHYLSLGQLDDMAARAGYALERRCPDWQWDRAVDGGTSNVVSVYRKG